MVVSRPSKKLATQSKFSQTVVKKALDELKMHGNL